jgi:hypothetical protein
MAPGADGPNPARTTAKAMASGIRERVKPWTSKYRPEADFGELSIDSQWSGQRILWDFPIFSKWTFGTGNASKIAVGEIGNLGAKYRHWVILPVWRGSGRPERVPYLKSFLGS